MFSKCKAHEEEIADLEHYVSDLIETIHYLEDGLARALNTDEAGVARFLCGSNDRFVPYLVLGSPLDEQLVLGEEETVSLLGGQQDAHH